MTWYENAFWKCLQHNSLKFLRYERPNRLWNGSLTTSCWAFCCNNNHNTYSWTQINYINGDDCLYVKIIEYWPHFYQTRSAWSVDQGSNKNHSPAYNFAPTVTKFCVMWEGLSLPHDTKFGNCRCKIVDSRSFPSWSLIHGLRWSGLIKVGPGHITPCGAHTLGIVVCIIYVCGFIECVCRVLYFVAYKFLILQHRPQ